MSLLCLFQKSSLESFKRILAKASSLRAPYKGYYKVSTKGALHRRRVRGFRG